MPRYRPTLTMLFAVSVLGLAALLAVLFHLFTGGLRRSVLRVSEGTRDQVGREIGGRVAEYLAQAERALIDLERWVQRGALDPGDPRALEAALYAVLASREDLCELTLTYGRKLGHEPDGRIRLAPEGRGQWSVYRVIAPAGEGPATPRHVRQGESSFVAFVRERPPGGGLLSAPLARDASAPAPGDPTVHLTFQTPCDRDHYGIAQWSDLAWAEMDLPLPPERRRVVMTVQKTIEDGAGGFVGVLRVGLLAEQLDRVTRLRPQEGGDRGGGAGEDPHRVFLCDRWGRLVTRFTPEDRLEEVGDDLRFAPAALPPEVAAALRSIALREAAPGAPPQAARVEAGGRDHLVSFRALEGTQGWVVGVIAPEEHYLGGLAEMTRRVVQAALAVAACILAGGALTLATVRRDLARVVDESARMRDFRFAAAEPRAALRDVAEVLAGLERAKTALRAMGKYVPLDLVRQLYHGGREPTLGGEPREVVILMSDIEGFTTVAERMATGDLARALGLYLEAMTSAVHEHQGIVDKYIGDAVMALWNALAPRPDPARLACAAALACLRRTETLYASPAWEGRPPLRTRIGLHADRVMVGNFGAPDRMNFTALGDGVNLAARLEGLNKVYGTSVIASRPVYDGARDAFAFRLLDRVAVKGKHRAIEVYELLGPPGEARGCLAAAEAYERGFRAYLARDFAAARAVLAAHPEDGPSRVLESRCARLLEAPPPADWDGVFVATEK